MTWTYSPLSSATTEELVEFMAKHSNGAMGRALAESLLTVHARDAHCVQDVKRGSERVGVAVLLDGLDNSDGAAELTLVLSHAALPAVDALLSWARELLRGTHHSFLDVPIWQGGLGIEGALREQGLRTAYTFFHMQRDEWQEVTNVAALSSAWHWVDCSEPCIDGYRDLTRRAFSQVPGAFVADLPAFRRAGLDPATPSYLLMEGGAIVGFVRVCVGEGGIGELLSLGRDPGLRGRRLGEQLVSHGLEQLRSLGACGCRLTVAAANENAVRLYERFGFAVRWRRPVYRAPLVGREQPPRAASETDRGP